MNRMCDTRVGWAIDGRELNQLICPFAQMFGQLFEMVEKPNHILCAILLILSV
jgi:hypothetical protein